MAPALFTAPSRLKDAGIISVIHKGKGSMPSVPVPPEKMNALIDFLLERDLDKATIDKRAKPGYKYRFDGYQKVPDAEGHPGVKPPWGKLNVMDLNIGKIAWLVPLGRVREFDKNRNSEDRHR